MDRKNVLMIVVDSMRSDALGINGNPICKTPNIDSIAQDGCSFPNCFSQNSACAPSRASILTGWYPHVRGHRTFTYHIQPDEENLFKYFKRSGYMVKAVGTNDCMHEDCFPDSIDEWMQVSGGAMDGMKGHLSEDPVKRRAFISGRLPEEDAHDRNWDIKEKSLGFIREKKDRPWFLYSAFHIPHPKYGIPEPWYSMYDPAQMPEPITPEHKGKHEWLECWRKISCMDQLDSETIKLIRAIYYGMVSLADDYVGQIINALKESGEYENTTIVFLSDHGDYTGDYGVIEKGHTCSEDCILNVPMIIKPPKGTFPAQKTSSSSLCETIDLLPTLLEINGIKEEQSHFGKSLLHLFENPDESHKNAVFAEGGYNPDEHFSMIGTIERDRPGFRSPESLYGVRELFLSEQRPDIIDRYALARTGEYKYVLRGSGSDEFYNLAEDPDEICNQIDNPEFREKIFEMKEIMLNWYLRTSDSIRRVIDDRLCAASWIPEHGLKK